MRVACLGTLLFLMPFLWPASAAGHGAHGTHGFDQAVVVTFAADHGPVAAGWRCTVFAPDGEPWSEGTLDRHGRIAFLPDRPGTWRVRGFAGDGHGADIAVPVDEELLAALRAGAARPDGVAGGFWTRVAAALGVLFGVFGVVALLQARRS